MGVYNMTRKQTVHRRCLMTKKIVQQNGKNKVEENEKKTVRHQHS